MLVDLEISYFAEILILDRYHSGLAEIPWFMAMAQVDYKEQVKDVSWLYLTQSDEKWMCKTLGPWLGLGQMYMKLS